jgi:hypothetical protein
MRFCETIKQSLPIAGVFDIELKGFKGLANGLPNVRASEVAFCRNCNTLQQDIGNGRGRLAPIPPCARDPCLQALGRTILRGHYDHRQHRHGRCRGAEHPDGGGDATVGQPAPRSNQRLARRALGCGLAGDSNVVRPPIVCCWRLCASGYVSFRQLRTCPALGLPPECAGPAPFVLLLQIGDAANHLRAFLTTEWGGDTGRPGMRSFHQ